MLLTFKLYNPLVIKKKKSKKIQINHPESAINS